MPRASPSRQYRQVGAGGVLATDGQNLPNADFGDFTSIDWLYHVSRQRRKSPPRSGWLQSLHTAQSWLAVLLVALPIGLTAGWVDIVLEWASDLKYGVCSTAWYLDRKKCCWEQWDDAASCDDWLSWRYLLFGARAVGFADFLLYTLFSTLFAASSVWLTLRVAPRFGSGSGIPEVKTILGGFRMQHFLDLRTALSKLLAMVFSVGSGMSIGNKAPLVHIATCFGDAVAHLFRQYRENEVAKRYLLSCASAAGIAVAFGSPIGGVLFSLEEISTYSPIPVVYRSFLCALMATLTLQMFDPLRTGEVVLFKDMTALLAGLLKECEESSYHGLCDAQSTTAVVIMLLYTGLFRYSTAILTYGIQAPAGIFIPSLVVGACLGRVFGVTVSAAQIAHPDWQIFAACQLEDKAQSCVSPGSYALLGAAALMTGVTRMTVSIAVIMLELTGALDFLLPIMITVLMAKLVADRIEPNSFADLYIRLNEYPFLDNKEEFQTTGTASDVMTPADKLIVLHNGMTVAQLTETINSTDVHTFPIVDSLADMGVEGIINKRDIILALAYSHHAGPRSQVCLWSPPPPSAAATATRSQSPTEVVVVGGAESNNGTSSSTHVLDLRPYADETPLCIHPQSNSATAFDVFSKLGVRSLLVKHFGRLVGIITKKDIIRFWHQHQHDHDPHAGLLSAAHFHAWHGLGSTHSGNTTPDRSYRPGGGTPGIDEDDAEPVPYDPSSPGATEMFANIASSDNNYDAVVLTPLERSSSTVFQPHPPPPPPPP
ncbi:glycerol ethanol, ferric requiring protein [Sorochytrium milnesiophthora]